MTRRLVLRADRIVTGDGRTVVDDGAIIVERGRVRAIEPTWDADHPGHVVDLAGHTLMPGFINCHTHGVAAGPLFPSAAPPPTEEVWRANLDRHLLGGTTTVLSLCGMVPMAAIQEADHAHPVHVRGAAGATPSAVLAARAADGAGLGPDVEDVETALDRGAVAIGEVGAGHTLGGGGQDLIYLPAAIRRRTGHEVTPEVARGLKEAVLGRHISEAAWDPTATERVLADAGLAQSLSPQQARSLVTEVVMPSCGPARASFAEAADLADRHGVPALFHSAAASAGVLRRLAAHPGVARSSFIACHSNHPSYTPAEAVSLATELARAGWHIEACTFDLLQGGEAVDTRAQWDAVLEVPDLVSLLATDYGPGGRHDSLAAAVADVVMQGHADLATAVAAVTGNVASAIPGLVEGPGRLEPGEPADITVCRSDDLADVRHVLVGGRWVVRDGRRLPD